MRKGILIAALAGLLAAGALLPAGAQGFTVSVGGQKVALVNQPIAMGADVLVPLRESLAAIGATNTQYMPSTKTVTFTYNGKSGVVDPRTMQASLGGQPMVLSGPIRNVNGRLYVRSQFVAQLNPDFQVSRAVARVAGYRAAPGFPTPAPVSSFSFNGRTFTYTAPTFYMGNDLMVPLSETLSDIGVPSVGYTPGDLQAAFTYNGQNVLLNFGSGYAYIGDQAVVLDRPVVVRDDRVYVPASFIQRLAPGFVVGPA